MKRVDIAKAQLTILIEINGKIHLTKMDKEKYDAVSFLTKNAVEELIKTNVSQRQLNKLLMPGWFE